MLSMLLNLVMSSCFILFCEELTGYLTVLSTNQEDLAESS